MSYLLLGEFLVRAYSAYDGDHVDRDQQPFSTWKCSSLSNDGKLVKIGGASNLYLWLATFLAIMAIIHLVLEYAPAFCG